MRIKNHFIARQAGSWKWTRAKEFDQPGSGRAWRIYDRFHDHLIGLIWEEELELISY